MKFLMPENMTRLHKELKKIDGYLAVAESMPETAMREGILDKLAASRQALIEQYGEFELDDGSTLVKHPGIGYITLEESLCSEPVRLFESKVKSLSTNRIRVYRCDALIGLNGNVRYVNRTLLIDVEMSQAAFAQLIVNPGFGRYPATIRHNGHEAVEFEGDISDLRAKILYDTAQRMTNGLSQWVDELTQAFDACKDKGGAMSQQSRRDVSRTANVLESWTNSNPGFYAKRLAEFSDSTTVDIKLEIMMAHKLKQAESQSAMDDLVAESQKMGMYE